MQFFGGCSAELIDEENRNAYQRSVHAWVHGVPVMSIGIAPDEIMRTHTIGIVTEHFEGLVAAARDRCANPSRRADMSIRASTYMRKDRDIRDRGDGYLRLFEEGLSIRAKQASRRSG
jgi:hypothetical protein